jgi:serine/threonine-protein phosphatase 2A activator
MHNAQCKQVKTWEKVNSGMIKMYMAEVLNKLPVIQHFLFGSIFPYDGPPPPSSILGDDAHRGHVHHTSVPNNQENETGWGDCCGIPIPSAFAAREMERKQPGMRPAGPGIRPVPFD